MEKNQNGFLRGQILMAIPGLNDPNFYRTVICICEHTSSGALGIVVNRIHSILSAKDIFDELKIRHIPEAESIPIHIGGPVRSNEIFVLHGPPFGWNGCFQITPLLAMSNTKDILEDVSMGKGPKLYIIALGCAGWSPQQLEFEIKENAWLTSSLCKDIIFEIPIERRWEEAMKKVGVNPALLSDTPGHA